MGIVVDHGIQKQIEALEAKGNFAQARELSATHEISLDSLAMQANVPAQFQARLSNSAAFQALRLQQHEGLGRKARNRDSLSRAFEMAVWHQRQIDSTMLTLKIGGKDLQISQGDLRHTMETRTEALKERRARLAQAGGNADEVRRMDGLIGRYEPVIKELKRGPADKGTMEEIDRLAKDDPEFAKQLERHAAPKLQTASDRRTSFAASEFDQGGIAAPSVTAAFARSANADTNPKPAPMGSPEFEQRRQNLDNTFQSFGL